MYPFPRSYPFYILTQRESYSTTSEERKKGQLVEKNAAVAHQRDSLKTKLLLELMIDNGVVSKEPYW